MSTTSNSEYIGKLQKELDNYREYVNSLRKYTQERISKCNDIINDKNKLIERLRNTINSLNQIVCKQQSEILEQEKALKALWLEDVTEMSTDGESDKKRMEKADLRKMES